jgi:hypothetical protein
LKHKKCIFSASKCLVCDWVHLKRDITFPRQL